MKFQNPKHLNLTFFAMLAALALVVVLSGCVTGNDVPAGYRTDAMDTVPTILGEPVHNEETDTLLINSIRKECADGSTLTYTDNHMQIDDGEIVPVDDAAVSFCFYGR